jgi:hypothetical protein
MPAPIYTIDPALLEYATASQREKLEAVIALGSMRKAAELLKCNKTGIRAALAQVKKKAAIYGYSPEHGLIKPVAPGFMAKGHSTFYDLRKPGAPAMLQWVKTSIDDKAREEIIREAINALMEDVPRAAPVQFTGNSMLDLCNVYTMTDCHVGMRAWAKETGADWDLKIAEQVLVAAFRYMIQSSPPADRCVVSQLGDFVHYDSMVAETPGHKHPLDADGRYSRVIRVAIRTLRAMVDEALLRHRLVDVIIAEGNHDPAGSVWLRQMFAMLYENEPRVTVIDSELPYYCIRHGTTMLGWHHGHLRKFEQLPALFAAQFAQDWGRTTKRYIHAGHRHHRHEIEGSGATLVQHPTLAARDAYAARGGWISERQVTAITYSARYGEVARNTVTPEMLEEG